MRLVVSGDAIDALVEDPLDDAEFSVELADWSGQATQSSSAS